MKNVLCFSFIIFTTLLFGHKLRYVSAENGLIVRENPTINSERIQKLDYGTSVYILRNTGYKLTVNDEGKKIRGEWVELDNRDGIKKGYVFNGYLTPDRLSKKLNLDFEDVYLQMELDSWLDNQIYNKSKNDSIIVYVDLGESLDGKKIKVKHSRFNKIEIYQRHENSLSIMNEGPHCDLTEWKHYDSEWNKLDYDAKNNTFIMDSYDEEDWGKFIDTDIEEVKTVVKKQCSDFWANLLTDTKNINEYPIGISISRIFLKIILTDKDGSVTEKTISFEIPMGC